MYDKHKILSSYIQEANIRLQLSLFAYEKEAYNTSIRECQDCVELLIKSLLLHSNQIVPESHNLKNEFRDIQPLLSKKLQEKQKYYLKFITQLRRERERSYYGEIEQNKTPQELYTQDDANYFINITKELKADIEKEVS